MPLFVLWFGLGNLSAIVLVAFVSSLQVVYNTWTGVKTTNPLWLRVGGSMNAIAGIFSEKLNILGLMPHPENHVDPVVGPTDGRRLFESLIETLAA